MHDVAQAVGKDVTWDSDTQTVYLGKVAPSGKTIGLDKLKPYNGSEMNPYNLNNFEILQQKYSSTNSFIIGGFQNTTYLLNGNYKTLSGKFGWPDDWSDVLSKQGQLVMLDENGKVLYQSPVLSRGQAPTDFNIDVTGVQKIVIKGKGSGGVMFDTFLTQIDN